MDINPRYLLTLIGMLFNKKFYKIHFKSIKNFTCKIKINKSIIYLRNKNNKKILKLRILKKFRNLIKNNKKKLLSKSDNNNLMKYFIKINYLEK